MGESKKSSSKENKKDKFEVEVEKDGFKLKLNINNTWTNANDDSTAAGEVAAQKGGEAAGHDQVSRGGELENTKAEDDLGVLPILGAHIKKYRFNSETVLFYVSD